MKCKFCGNDLPEESKFCPSCGAPVEPEEQTQTEQSAEAEQAGQQDNQNPYEYGVPGADNGTQNENPYQYGNAGQSNENPYQYGNGNAQYNGGQNTYTDYNANNGAYGQPQKPIDHLHHLTYDRPCRELHSGMYH